MTAADVAEPPTLDPYRLPARRRPARYDVELAPDLAAATFDGRVEIAVDVVEPVDELVLNAIELDIVEVRVDGSDVALAPRAGDRAPRRAPRRRPAARAG